MTMPEQTAAKKRIYRSLVVTLAIAFLALSMTILIITTCLQGYSTIQNQQKVISDQQQLIAQGAADTVTHFISNKITALEGAASLGNLAVSSKDQQKVTLDKLLHLEPSFRQVILLNTSGKELARVSRLSIFESKELSEQYKYDIFYELSLQKTYISPVYIDEKSGEPMVIMAVPVKNVFGDFKGILAAEVNLKFMWDLVGSLKIGNSGTAYVVDGQGNLIAFGDISRVLKGENIFQLMRVSEFVKNKGSFPVFHSEVSKGIRGNDVVSSYVPLGTPDWAVVVELPVNEAYEPAFQGLVRSIIIMFISLVLATVTGIYLSKRITKPIINLRDATREISKGNLDTRVEIESKNEIGELAESFNKMTEDLQKTTVSKNYVDDILKSMFDMLVVLTPDNTIRTVNQAACDVLGYGAEELVGQPFEILLADENMQPKGAWINELIDKGALNNTEKVFTTKNGRKIPVVFSASIMRDNEGTIQGIVCVAHDITERKQAEEALHGLNADHEAIIDNAPAMIWYKDTKNNFIRVNPAAAKAFGKSIGEIEGKNASELFPDMAEKYYQDDLNVIKSGKPNLGIIEQMPTASGERIWVQTDKIPLKDDWGTIRGILVFVVDITERKKADELLKHFNEELEQNVKTRTEQLNASLEEKVVLLREIHHRVKNNLQIIISLTNLQMHQLDDPKVKQIMVETQNRVRAMSFVHEKLYRSEDISHINLADYTRFLATHLFTFYGVDSRQVALKIEIGKIMLDINTAIPVGLIINELVSNAIKHAFPDGRKGEIWISVGQQDHTLTILFGDDGIGIPQDVDWRTVPSLGLRLVILLVDQLNGTIELDRSAGTMFKIVLQQKG